MSRRCLILLDGLDAAGDLGGSLPYLSVPDGARTPRRHSISFRMRIQIAKSSRVAHHALCARVPLHRVHMSTRAPHRVHMCTRAPPPHPVHT